MIQALNVELITLSSVLCQQKGNIYKQKKLLKKKIKAQHALKFCGVYFQVVFFFQASESRKHLN